MAAAAALDGLGVLAASQPKHKMDRALQGRVRLKVRVGRRLDEELLVAAPQPEQWQGASAEALDRTRTHLRSAEPADVRSARDMRAVRPRGHRATRHH